MEANSDTGTAGTEPAEMAVLSGCLSRTSPSPMARRPFVWLPDERFIHAGVESEPLGFCQQIILLLTFNSGDGGLHLLFRWFEFFGVHVCQQIRGIKPA